MFPKNPKHCATIVTPLGWKAIIIILLTTIISNAQAGGRPVPPENVTHVTTLKSYGFETVLLKNSDQQLISTIFTKVYPESYGFKPEDTYTVKIIIESNSIPDDQNNTCEVVAKPAPGRDLYFPEVSILSNDKLLIILLESRDVGNYLRIHVLNLRNHCSSQRYSLSYDDALYGLTNHPYKIIPYNRTFDLFAKSKWYCKPEGSACIMRFNDRGKFLRKLFFPPQINNKDMDFVHFSPLIEFDSTAGFVHVETKTSTVMTIFNSDLEIVKQKQLNNRDLGNVAVKNNVIVICHDFTNATIPRTKCKKYNQNLKQLASYDIPHWGYYHKINLHNLMDGSSLLVFHTRGYLDLGLKRLGINGGVSKTEMLSYDCQRYENLEVDFVETYDSNYCFNFKCERNKFVTHCATLEDLPKLKSFVDRS